MISRASTPKLYTSHFSFTSIVWANSANKQINFVSYNFHKLISFKIIW
jgi:hypothetical protein